MFGLGAKNVSLQVVNQVHPVMPLSTFFGSLVAWEYNSGGDSGKGIMMISLFIQTAVSKTLY